MVRKIISNRKRLAAVFASFSIIIMGTVSLLQSMSIDYYSVLGTLTKVIPAAFALGCLGWVMGMVLDKPKKGSRFAYNQLLLDDLLKSENALAPDITKVADIDVGNVDTSEEKKDI